MMTVEELINLLEKFPRDMRVIKAKDDEGNSFLQVYGAELGFSPEPEAWKIETVYTQEEFEEEVEGYHEEQDWHSLVVLW